MVTNNSYITGKLVLSVIDSHRPIMADRNSIPVTESEILVDKKAEASKSHSQQVDESSGLLGSNQ
jgi:hypothetical protein